MWKRAFKVSILSVYMPVMIMRPDSFSNYLKNDNVSTIFILAGDRGFI